MPTLMGYVVGGGTYALATIRSAFHCDHEDGNEVVLT